MSASHTSYALIGASGFIGLRTTEILHGKNGINIVPIVRSPSSLAVLARQRLDWRIADPLIEDALTAALKNCPVAIHAAIGDAAQIVRMARTAYLACAAAGVTRLVWLSSASVHGQNAATGTDENSPLHTEHNLEYNNAKVQAEAVLRSLAKDGRVQVVMLRPGVVFGPRSRWITDAANDIRHNRAAWLNNGNGICNSIYVDNLVEAIRLCAVHPKAAGETFLVGDAETVTWRDFLLPIATHLGASADVFADATRLDFPKQKRDPLAPLKTNPAVSQLKERFPYRIKRFAKGVLSGLKNPPAEKSVWTLRTPQNRTPALSEEMTLLQECAWKLPNTKAEQILGYRQPVSFSEGMRRSLAWLNFVSD